MGKMKERQIVPRQQQAHTRPDGTLNQSYHSRGVHIYKEAEVTSALPAGFGDFVGDPRQDLIPRIVFRGPVEVSGQLDHLVIGPIGSRYDYLTVTFKPEVRITTGCFSGTLADFETELSEAPRSQTRDEYAAAIGLIRAAAKYRANLPPEDLLTFC